MSQKIEGIMSGTRTFHRKPLPRGDQSTGRVRTGKGTGLFTAVLLSVNFLVSFVPYTRSSLGFVFDCLGDLIARFETVEYKACSKWDVAFPRAVAL